MPEIHVTLPEKGKTFVDNDPEAVVSERRIEWHFHSKHAEATRVGIEFQDPKSEIFKIEKDKSAKVKLAEAELTKAMSSGANSAEISLAEVNLAEAKSEETQAKPVWRSNFATDLKNNRATIWAEPDRLGPKGEHTQARLKYTIIAWNAEGERIQELVLDPHIIIDDP